MKLIKSQIMDSIQYIGIASLNTTLSWDNVLLKQTDQKKKRFSFPIFYGSTTIWLSKKKLLYD